MYDVLIIGAGVVGGLIARGLSRYSLKICIAEKGNDVAMGATKANSAIVHAGFDAETGTLKAKLNVKGTKMMKDVCQNLGVKYINNGSLVIGFNDEDKDIIDKLYQRGINNGVEKLEILNQDDLRKIEPNISKDAVCALYAPTAGIVCPYELAMAAIGNAMDNGTDLKLNFEVTDIVKQGDFYRVYSDANFLEAKYIINAAGLYSDRIANMIGDTSFTIHPRRGEYILLDKECGTVVSHTIFRTPNKMGKGILVTPTVDKNLLIGPTSVDITDKEDKQTTEAGLKSILKTAGEGVTNIQFRSCITSFAGLRAVGSTNDFIINMPNNSFVNVAGIESPGLSSAPAIAEYVIELLKQHNVKLETKNEYISTRKPMHYFKQLSIEEKNKIIKKDKTFGKIICRCEGVTEGEILEAIHTNPKPQDLDGIKRRTRTQMGRCQGGFCSPYVTELLAKELKIPHIDVTKSGGKSKINLYKIKEVIEGENNERN